MTGDTGGDIPLGAAHEGVGLHASVVTAPAPLGSGFRGAVRCHAASAVAGQTERLLAVAPPAVGIV